MTLLASGGIEKSILGIDLGTTHSLAAWVPPGGTWPELLPTACPGNSENSPLLPSVLTYNPPHWQIGHRLDRIRSPHTTVFSIKRLLGLSPKEWSEHPLTLPYPVREEAGLLKIELGGQTHSPIALSSLLLGELKKQAEQFWKTSFDYAVITVPAYFNDAQRQATRLAGRMAGLQVLRIVNEPTAAALAYGLLEQKQGYVAVYDLGGGTFDLSLLHLHEGIFEVLATCGDTALGGDDFDLLLAQASAQEWGLFSQLSTEPEWLACLLQEAEKVKCLLSTQSEAHLSVVWKGKEWRTSWTQRAFAKLIAPLLERAQRCCQQALQDAGLQVSDLTAVLLVGGSTRIPAVQQAVTEFFGQHPQVSLNPDTAVALGAALQGHALSRRKDGSAPRSLLLDVTPLSLGIETYGGKTAPLLPRNTRIPALAQEVFTNFVEGQTSVSLHVVQGEAEEVSLNRSLARFELPHLPLVKAGQARIQVSFLIDADGILQVSAKDLLTQQEKTIEVKPSSGLSCETIEKMLGSAYASSHLSSPSTHG